MAEQDVLAAIAALDRKVNIIGRASTEMLGAPGINYCTNPSLETDSDSDGLADGWAPVLVCSERTFSGVAALDGLGVRAQRMELAAYTAGDSINPGIAYDTAAGSFAPGDPRAASFSYRVNSALGCTASVWVQSITSGGSNAGYVSTALIGDGSVHRFSAPSASLPAGTSRIRLIVKVSDNWGAGDSLSIDVDDVIIAKASTAIYFDGSYPGAFWESVEHASRSLRVASAPAVGNVDYSPYSGALPAAIKVGAHFHTTASDGTGSLTAMIDEYKALGYDACMSSDHQVTVDDPAPAVEGITFIRGVEESVTQLTPGVATSASFAHIVHPGTHNESLVAQQVINASSLAWLAHPTFAQGGGGWWQPAEALSLAGYAGAAVYNAMLNETDETFWDALLAKDRHVWGFAEDDAHAVAGVGGAAMYVFAANTASEIVEALRDGRFYSTRGPILGISESATGLTVTSPVPATFVWTDKHSIIRQTDTAVMTSTYVYGTLPYNCVRCTVTRDSDGKKAWVNPVFFAGSEPTRWTLRDELAAPSASAASADAKLDAVLLKTNTIGSLAVTVTSPVAASGTITIEQGDSYPAGRSRPIDVNVDDPTHAKGLDAVNTTLYLLATQFTWEAASVTETTPGYRVRFEPTIAQTAAVLRGQSYKLKACIDNVEPTDDDAETIQRGRVVLNRDIPAIT